MDTSHGNLRGYDNNIYTARTEKLLVEKLGEKSAWFTPFWQIPLQSSASRKRQRDFTDLDINPGKYFRRERGEL